MNHLIPIQRLSRFSQSSFGLKREPSSYHSNLQFLRFETKKEKSNGGLFSRKRVIPTPSAGSLLYRLEDEQRRRRRRKKKWALPRISLESPRVVIYAFGPVVPTPRRL
ncbi:hypothetical protein CDAR_379381 [Caerostris darwini]|uniref:Ribosomal protein S18 n=1 Tax=Caerostris darwini TaxID=1538125 RepID=A0AAV4V9I9_9ARAC|nr:hypothetical protein CDAR_379381 [Caerostris darwini]